MAKKDKGELRMCVYDVYIKKNKQIMKKKVGEKK